MPLYSYECSKGHSYDAALKVEDYQKKTKCPTCKRVGKKVISIAQKEPTFSDKIFPYYDKSLNKIFNNRSERSSYLQRKGLVESGNGTMTAKQERDLYTKWRIGGFDPKDARNVLRD